MISKKSCKDFIARSHTSKFISDNIFKDLIENCFAILTGKSEVHSCNTLYGSKGDAIKEFYAYLLSITAEICRKTASIEEIEQLLTNSGAWSSHRVSFYLEHLEKNRRGIEYSLLNTGICLPHLVDARWKIDYIIKSSMVDKAEGPVFRICLISEEYDTEKECKKLKNIHFTCSSQELQDLVYKLKDAVRHCHSITNRLH